MADEGETTALWFYSSTILFPFIMAVMWCNWHSIADAVISYLKCLVTQVLSALVTSEPLTSGLPSAWPVPSPSPYLGAVDMDAVKKRRKATVGKSRDTSALDSEILQLQEQVHYLNHELEKRESTPVPQDTSGLEAKILSLTEENLKLTAESNRRNTITPPQDTSVLEVQNLRLTEEYQSLVEENNRLNTTTPSQDPSAQVNENLKLRGQVQSLALEVNRGIQSQHDEADGVREAYESEIQRMKTLAQQNHDQEIAQLIHDHDAQVNNLRTTNEELNTNVNKLTSDAEDRDTLVNQLSHGIAMRDAKIQELTNDHDTQVNGLKNDITIREAKIQELIRDAAPRSIISGTILSDLIQIFKSSEVKPISLKTMLETTTPYFTNLKTPDTVFSDHDTLVNTPTPPASRDATHKRVVDEDVHLALRARLSNMELDGMEVDGDGKGPVGPTIEKRNMRVNGDEEDGYEHVSKRRNHVYLLSGQSKFQADVDEATLMKYNREVIRLRQMYHICQDISNLELVDHEIEVNPPIYICPENYCGWDIKEKKHIWNFDYDPQNGKGDKEKLVNRLRLNHKGREDAARVEKLQDDHEELRKEDQQLQKDHRELQNAHGQLEKKNMNFSIKRPTVTPPIMLYSKPMSKPATPSPQQTPPIYAHPAIDFESTSKKRPSSA